MKSPSSEAATGSLARPIPQDGIAPVEDWPEAQQRANFVLVAPRAGTAWRVAEATLRGESPAHHSTLRVVLEDGTGRRVRAKQFLNDWWIPTVADISFRTPGRPIVFDRDQVAFVGRDYRRQAASCGHLWGTSVEFSVEAGELDDDAWGTLWTTLAPAVPSAVGQARASSYARRNYWNRWGRTHAPWDTSEIASLAWSDPTTEAMESTAWAVTADRWAALPGAVDSLGARSGPFGDEVQAVFRWPVDLNVSAWLRVLRAPPEPWRPLVDASEVNRPRWEATRIGGVEVERAAMDPTVGNWFFAWREGTLAMELHLRAQGGLDRSRAEAAVAGLRG